MWWFVSWILLVVCWAKAQERENGILYDHDTLGIMVWYPPKIMRSNSYPNPAPHDLVQTWRYVGRPESGMVIAIKIVCNQISIPKVGGDCGDNKMTLEEGGRIVKEYCGQYGPFVYISETNDVTFELRTGSRGGAIVDCTGQAIPVTRDRIEITTTTTTTPKPTMPAFLTIPSEDVDSSEHGGEEGAKGTTCQCGWANKVTSRVVNGTETARNEFPFAAGVIYRGTRGSFCGSTIITKYHALTAAHCTRDEVAENLSIIPGIHTRLGDWDRPEYPVERFVSHEGYDNVNKKHDISLLILEKEIQFNQFVGPACLPPVHPSLQLDRQYIKIIGWGATSHNGSASSHLRKVNVRVVPMKECKYMYSDLDAENPTQICTYEAMKASCFGDSGGPVMWLDPETNRYTHVGIVSFGRICADHNPSVHTRVQAYLDWIQYHIRASRKPGSQTCSKIN